MIFSCLIFHDVRCSEVFKAWNKVSFQDQHPSLSLLQILALKEANNILIMKQIKQLPLCPLSGFTSPAPPDNQQQFLMLMSS